MASTRSLLACPPCETGPFARNHFFTGKLLVERDFTDEQRYFIDKLRHHHRRLHGWGVVCGLKVKPHPSAACRDRFVCIEPGTAIDCCGREIVVREEECVDLSAFAELRDLFEQAGDEDATAHALRISLCYRECPTEDIPVLYDECGCDDTHCAPNRILESFRFSVQVDPPEEPATDAPGVALKHVHTLAVAQARRVAVDAEQGRIYVLSGATPATLTAFSAANHSLVGSLGFAAGEEPTDLAVSADGERVYVSVHSASALQVRVLDPALAPVHTLTLPDNGAETVFVAAAPGGRLYALNGNNRKLYAWDHPDTDTAAERQELATIGNGPSALRVAPDGARAFAAAADGASVAAVEAADGSAETLSLAAGARPVSLAAAGGVGAERLYVGEEDGHLRVFGVQPGESTPFPALGSATLPGSPVDLAATRGGRWVFALLEAADGTATVQAVDTHAVEAGSGDPLGAVVEVEAEPRSLALAPGGRRLYAASEGPAPAGGQAPGGGVAVIDVTQTECAEIFLRSLDGCPECTEECLTLATIREWLPGTAIEEAAIDNLDGRRLLPSTTDIVDVVRCLLERECDCEGGGGPGEPGPPGAGIDAVQATLVDCTDPGSAAIQTIAGVRTLVLRIPRGCDGQDATSAGIDAVQAEFVPCTDPGSAAIRVIGTQRTLVLEIPRGCDGANGTNGTNGTNGRDGTDGQDGRDGTDGVGLEPGLTRIRALSWTHNVENPGFVPIRDANGQPLRNPFNNDLPLIGLVIGFTGNVRRPEPVGLHIFQVLASTVSGGIGSTNNREIPPLQVCRCTLAGLILPVQPDPPAGTGLITGATVLQGNLAPGLAWVPLDRRNPLTTIPRFFSRELWVSLRGDFVVDEGGRAVDAEFTRSELATGDRPAGSGFGIQGGIFESWFTLPEVPGGTTGGSPVTGAAGRSAGGALLSAIGRATADDALRDAYGVSDEELARIREMINDRPEEG